MLLAGGTVGTAMAAQGEYQRLDDVEQDLPPGEEEEEELLHVTEGLQGGGSCQGRGGAGPAGRVQMLLEGIQVCQRSPGLATEGFGLLGVGETLPGRSKPCWRGSRSCQGGSGCLEGSGHYCGWV